MLEPLLEERDLKLVDIEYITEGRPILRIFIYNPEGTSIDDCEWISRRIGALLDVEDLIPVSYTLEVSSPGLERKLKNEEEYDIFKGRDIKIVLKEPLDKKNVIRGILKGKENREVVVEEEGEDKRIPIENIARANLEFK
ncbi:ribosome maturation factor RimP [Persephonella sp.]